MGEKEWDRIIEELKSKDILKDKTENSEDYNKEKKLEV